MSLSGFKYICLLPLLILACKDIPRDNPLDPKNSDSFDLHRVSLEVFVNTNDSIPFDYNLQMLDALDVLKQKYDERIGVVEYHRNVQNYEDPYHSPENEALYTKYTDMFPEGIRGVPDVFINGTLARVQGAYDGQGSTLIRLEQAIEPELLKNSRITIEPEVFVNGNSAEITVRVGVLGHGQLGKILVRVVTISQIDNQYHKRIASAIRKSTISPVMNAGDVKEFDIGTIPLPVQGQNRLMIQVLSDDELVIYQSREVDLP